MGTLRQSFPMANSISPTLANSQLLTVQLRLEADEHRLQFSKTHWEHSI